MIISIISLILILVLMPFAAGLVPAFFIHRDKRRISMIYISGMIISMAVFQFVAVPIIIFNPSGFNIICGLYTSLMAMISIGGLIIVVMDYMNFRTPYIKIAFDVNNQDAKAFILIAFALVLLQMIASVVLSSFDGDDSYYVVHSLLTYETDTLYRIQPYTGLSTSMDIRHALATVPIFIAYIARMSGIHSTIIAHSVMGIVLIPLLYLVYYECAQILFRGDSLRIAIFMVLINIMYLFGQVSIYTNATFFLTRTWQGKSILSNFVIMSVFWLLLALFDTITLKREWRLGYWMLIPCLCMVAAMCSTSSVFLIAMLIGIMGLLVGITRRNIQIVLRLLVCCIPLMVYGAIYLIL